MTGRVIVEETGRLGILTLDRPKAINALDLEMVQTLRKALDGWRHDDRISRVLLRGLGPRGFCAGGDVLLVRDALRVGEPQVARDFWRQEYELNARIAAFPKPIVVVMQGIVMGGGIGLAGHADRRLVTADSAIAMPEVKIGLAPDVGGTYLLARAPGELGTHLALTGRTIGAADAILCGLADCRLSVEALVDLPEALRDGDVDAVLAELTAGSDGIEEEAALGASRSWIDPCYAGESVEAIVARLEARTEPAAQTAAGEIAGRSPLALKVTLEALRRAREMSTVAECLEQDYRVSCAFLNTHDLPEGIRAVLVDKDRRPRWSPAELSEVTKAMVSAHFAPIPDGPRLPAVQS